ncbi:MAG: hypothetical protein AAGD28_11375 [Bacteroidota bacterium]
MFSPELLAQERKNIRVSAVTTTAIMVILALLCLIFTAYRNRVPPPGKKYEVLGAIDFGDMREGSKNVNTRERSVPDPVENPTPKPTPPQPTPQPVEAAPTPPPRVTTPKPTPVAVPDPPVKKPEPVEQPKVEKPQEPKPTPKPTNTQTKPTETKPADKPSTNTDSRPSGSNDGSADSGTGNKGTPNTTVLNKDGLYSFGEGIGGSNGRGILSIRDPDYKCQEEGTLTFKFQIMPNGSVGRVFRPISNKRCLVQIGMAAIRGWKFTSSPGAGVLETNVTIRFKLN